MRNSDARRHGPFSVPLWVFYRSPAVVYRFLHSEKWYKLKNSCERKARTMTIQEFLKKNLLLMDGAMGTQIQDRNPSAEVWGEYDGCNEWLNLAAPEIIKDIHRAYYRAGSDAVETNTFGSSPNTLGEYNLAARAKEISMAAAERTR